MKILAVECSASPASAAITENGKVIASAYTNVKLTHSQTLMPMISSVLSSSLTDINDIDGFAVSAGPGSFTGIRIGISAVKGLAAPEKKACAAVSTLRSMAENCRFADCVVCAVMDARCSQVYNAIFDIKGGKITRICDDRAIMCEELEKELKNMSQNVGKDVIIVGDGAEMFYEYVKDVPNVRIADENMRYQNAVSVASAAQEMFEAGDTVQPDRLLPVYLRLPQAERELKSRTAGKRE